MLPLHGNATARRPGGWREMPIVTGDSSPPTPYKRLTFRLRPLRSISRLTFVVAGGAIFCLWLMFSQLGAPPFMRPFPPEPPLNPHHRPPPYAHPPRPPFVGGVDDGADEPPEGTFVDWAARAEEVKKMFVRAYHAYEEYASPKDELRPMTNGSINK